jgi:hypothetical protein
MGDKAREIKSSTLKKLYGLSANQCMKPDCNKNLIASDNKTQIGIISHIEAASEKGPRFNSNMKDDDRRHFNNLILLCDECHKIIDNKENEKEFPVELLKKWKKEHEEKVMFSSLRKSYLDIAIDAISNLKFDENKINKEKLEPFNISEKIQYNSIKRNKSLINTYKLFYSKINKLYDELDRQGSFKKENLLRNIGKIYIEIKGKYVKDQKDEISIIRENVDNIIDDVEDELIRLSNEKIKENISFEISIILVDAFMRCKILEEPKK